MNSRADEGVLELDEPQRKFGLRGVMLLTAAVASILFFAIEGVRFNSWLRGFGLLISAVLSAALLLYLGSRFSSRPGAVRRIIFVVIVLSAITAWLIFPRTQ